MKFLIYYVFKKKYFIFILILSTFFISSCDNQNNLFDDSGQVICESNYICNENEYCQKQEGLCDSNGICVEKPILLKCPKNAVSVCGCDNLPYPNECEANSFGISVFSQGKCHNKVCLSNDMCSDNEFCKKPTGSCYGRGFCAEMPNPKSCQGESPVCGCDGDTYNNECDAASKGIIVRHDGECSIESIDLLIVVDKTLLQSLSDKLETYRSDLQADGYSSKIIQWDQGDEQFLKDLLIQENRIYNIAGALLIGNLPAAWYEQTGFSDDEEQFPCDIYYMDLDSTWTDNDSDGIYDGHPLIGMGFQVEIFVSRIIGTSYEIINYFDKVHKYRTDGSLTEKSAYIFIDDDWENSLIVDSFLLENIYSEVDICDTATCTTRENYIDKLSDGGGAEFVCQWIHASPTSLSIDVYGDIEKVDRIQIPSINPRGSFYNLVNCSASRFTEPNLAMTYLIGTDYGLATVGSTKRGGMTYSHDFHNQLGLAQTWGEAYKQWYNLRGITSDLWFMGIVIHGDPMLKLVSEAANINNSILSEQILDADTTNKMNDIMKKYDQELSYTPGTYEEYKQRNQIFK